MMGNTASYAGDYRVGFGLLAACALTLALIGVGVTAFVLERMALALDVDSNQLFLYK